MWLTLTKALAYYTAEFITAVKSFMKQAQEAYPRVDHGEVASLE